MSTSPQDLPAPPSRRRRFKRWFLITLKWCRISFLLLCLVVIVVGLFLNHVGLPDWLERRVEEQFRSKGWDMQYSRLRLRWYHGIVAEDLQLQRTKGLHGPSLFVPHAEFRLNWKAIQHLDLEANSALLSGGRLIWPLPGTNAPRRTLLIDNIAGEVRFGRSDVWDLQYLQAEILGARIRFRGDITNASLIREWRLTGRPRPPAAEPGRFWHRFLTVVEQIRFSGQPEFQVMFSGDAQNWKSFEAQVRFVGQAAASPWASGTNLFLTAHLLPSPRSNDAVRADVRLTADHAQTLWGAATNLDLSLVFEPSFTHVLPTNTLALLELRGASNRWCRAERIVLEVRSSPAPTNNTFNLTSVDLSLDRFESRLLNVRETRVNATSLHPATNLFPATVDSIWTMPQLESAWITSAWSQVRAKLELPSLPNGQLTDTNRSWPERLQSVAFNLRGTFTNVLAPKFQAQRAQARMLWRTPLFEFNAGAEDADANLSLESALHAETREWHFRTENRLSPGKLAAFLGTNARPWLASMQFASPPRAQVNGRLLLPPWRNQLPDWNADILPALEASGHLDFDAGEYRGVTWESAQVPFAITNLMWTVPSLTVSRPEGALVINGTADQRTGSFRGTARSEVDWSALRTAFSSPKMQRLFGWCQLSVPPVLLGEAQGNWRDWTQVSGHMDVALTNCAFREQAIKACTTRLVYTNQFLSILQPVVWREGEEAHAEGIGIDLKVKQLFLTNAVGRLTPRAVTKCIGPQTDLAVSPYVFDRAPFARVEGTVPLGRSDGTENMRFEIEGGPFHWQRFNLEQIKGTLVWRGKSLSLTNLAGRWHGADLGGWANFDFTPRHTDRFEFFARLERADLRRVLRDLQPGKTNKVEGTMSGELRITSADTHDWGSWQGYGHAYLTNGLLWDTPLFSMFSPILNAFVPGLGNIRARHATATYQITNSVIHSQDLVIRGTALRMNYRGSVDFDTRLDGRMEAELLRDLPAFGFVFSKLLWPVTKLFDYKVTGTLDHPKTEELYMLSKIIMVPLHPLKTLKELINLEDKPGSKPPP